MSIVFEVSRIIHETLDQQGDPPTNPDQLKEYLLEQIRKGNLSALQGIDFNMAIKKYSHIPDESWGPSDYDTIESTLGKELLLELINPVEYPNGDAAIRRILKSGFNLDQCGGKINGHPIGSTIRESIGFPRRELEYRYQYRDQDTIDEISRRIDHIQSYGR